MEEVFKLIGIVTTLVGVVIFALLLTPIFALLFAWPIMWCWNYAMPHAFGLPTIGYWHAYCLYLMATYLLKSSAVQSKN